MTNPVNGPTTELLTDPRGAFDLTGRVACITGGAAGIGECVARMFAGAGASVVLGDIDEIGLRRVCDDIVAAGGQAVAQATDARHKAEVDALVDRAVTEYGRLDVMCNIAGVGSYGPIEGVAETEVDRAFAINFKGPLFGCQAALRVMQPQGSGSIVNVSATAIYTPAAGIGIYAATKAAVAMLTQTLAVEAGAHGVRVNAIAPGFTLTNFVGGHLRDADGNHDADEFAAYLERMRTMSPLGLLGEASDQAYLVLYLASDASRFTTGTILRANGGQSIDW
jgi:3-oxoacyl-[acyl-carrier protein] reductase